MIGKLIAVIAVLLAAAAGLYGGEILRGASDGKTIAQGDHGTVAGGADAKTDDAAGAAAHEDAAAASAAKAGGHGKGANGPMSYYRFPSQFFVPVMHGDRLDGMMVLTLTIEMPADLEEDVYKKEFRLRDAFLRTLLIHANTGGFDGNFTIEPRMRRLREALMATAAEVSADMITDVLIEDIARQDAA